MHETIFNITGTPFGWTMSCNGAAGQLFETLDAALEVAHACGFRSNPDGDSDVKSDTVPI